MKLFASYFKALAWLMAALLAAVAAGCGGGGESGSGSAVSGTGTLRVSLTDMPACGFDQVNVTVRKVRVHRSSSASATEGGWIDIPLNPPRKINLLDLANGVLDGLGEAPLPAGHYTQVRLVLDPNNGAGMANTVVPTGGVETPLVTPSAVQSGIKLVHPFDVAPGEQSDLVLDFNVCKSIVVRGNGTYALKPVIKVVPIVLNGISGFVDAALLGANVMVTAQQDGVVVQGTAPNPQTGEFLLARVAPGNYDVVFTANDRATAVITAVPVDSTTSTVAVSTSAAPITLPVSGARLVSGTATLNPASPDTATSVAAKQALSGGLIVTVKSVVADDMASGAYTLILPTDAPQLGAYSATLPVILAAEPGAAGLYTIEASASGYATQSAGVNISAADAVQSFVLVP